MSDSQSSKDNVFRLANPSGAASSLGGSGLFIPFTSAAAQAGLGPLPFMTGGSAFRPTNAVLSSTSSDDTGSSPEEVQRRMEAMQELFNRKQAELLLSYQQAQSDLALQHFQYLQHLSANSLRDELEAEKQRQLAASLGQLQASIAGVHLPSTEASQSSSSLGNISGSAVSMFESQGELHSPTFHSGNHQGLKRSLSHNSQTISVHTREKLKTMLANKMKNREKGGLNSSPHFEPYPPLHVNATDSAHNIPSDFQLRKASSEPNLKMRIRAKLLNRNQPKSPTFPLPPSFGSPPAFAPRTAPVPIVRGSAGENGAPPGGAQAFIFPSPSLPNIPQNPVTPFDKGHFPSLDLNSATAALLASGGLPLSGGIPNPNFFFSMPSIYPFVGGPGSQLQQMGLTLPLSISTSSQAPPLRVTAGANVDMASTGTSRTLKPVDMRAFTSPLPIGGHPSLLKQQLRDLVLRRKSLVREETDDEVRREISVIQAITAENGSRTQGFYLGRTGLAYDSAMSKHQCLCGHNKQHVEHGGRIHSVWARLQERGLVERCERVAARKAHLDMLKLCHSETYVTFFGISPTACLKMDPTQLPLRSFVQLPCGGIGVDSDTYFNDANTQMAARFAVGHLVELSLAVAEKRLRNGFAVIRPPGHHAEKDQAMGFCYFNNVAIAARMVQQRCGGSIKKIAILDWDVHHGNGTQLAFERDPNILFLSIHRHDNGNFFPGTGAVTEIGTEEGRGFTVNIPWTGGTMGDAEYLAAWRTVVAPVLDQFQPDLVLVSAGFDAARGHPPALGGYLLSPQIFGHFTRQLAAYGQGRVVLALEGGYDLAAICDAAEECVGALLGIKESGKLTEESLNTKPQAAAVETLQKVVAVHKKYWLKLTGEGLGTSQAEWDAMHSRFASLSVNQES